MGELVGETNIGPLVLVIDDDPVTGTAFSQAGCCRVPGRARSRWWVRHLAGAIRQTGPGDL